MKLVVTAMAEVTTKACRERAGRLPFNPEDLGPLARPRLAGAVHGALRVGALHT